MSESIGSNSRKSEFQDKKAVICFFIAESVVLFASKESDSNRSELTKQVTDAQLAKALIKSLQRMRLMRSKFFLRCTKPVHKEKTCKQEPARRKLKENLQARPNPQ